MQLLLSAYACGVAPLSIPHVFVQSIESLACLIQPCTPIYIYREVYNFFLCDEYLKGFDVDGDIPLMFPGQIIPLDTFDYSRNVIHVFSDIALSHYEVTRFV